jgi:hypothetical protein
VPLFWIMLQSRTDATDIIYLNVADRSRNGTSCRRATGAVAAHPELEDISPAGAFIGKRRAS